MISDLKGVAFSILSYAGYLQQANDSVCFCFYHRGILFFILIAGFLQGSSKPL